MCRKLSLFNKIIIAFTAVVMLVSLLITIVFLFNFDDYKDYLEEKKAEENLESLNTGISIDYVGSIFGVPLEGDIERDSGRWVYSFEKFYLRIDYRNNVVTFYSVTVKDPKFKPQLPYEGRTLGGTFASFYKRCDANDLNTSSKDYSYYERINRDSNSSGYRPLYLGYTAVGAEYCKPGKLMETSMEIEDLDKRKKILNVFRQESCPNSFGIGEYGSNSDSQKVGTSCIFEYFDVRDMPENIYF